MQFHDTPYCVAGIPEAQWCKRSAWQEDEEERLEPIELYFHDLRRSAHYQMRKAGVDSQTRRDIMGHESTSMTTDTR